MREKPGSAHWSAERLVRKKPVAVQKHLVLIIFACDLETSQKWAIIKDKSDSRLTNV